VAQADRLRLAAAAYLSQFEGAYRDHTHSDLRCYLAWCTERSLGPLTAPRPHLELYIRWMQEIRRFKPLHGVTLVLGDCRVLPDLRHRRRYRVLTRRACPRQSVPRRVADARVHVPAVRGAAHSCPRVRQPARLRFGGHVAMR
jgi:hypothetical protein